MKVKLVTNAMTLSLIQLVVQPNPTLQCVNRKILICRHTQLLIAANPTSSARKPLLLLLPGLATRISRAALCQPPKVSAARETKVSPSWLHLSPFFLTQAFSTSTLLWGPCLTSLITPGWASLWKHYGGSGQVSIKSFHLTPQI